MINTNELMLGNLVEYKGEYAIITSINHGYVLATVQKRKEHCLMADINPIELTDDVLNKLRIKASTKKSVHELQNSSMLHGIALDITPLLKPKPILTTHDGVEVFDKSAVVYICYEDATNSFDGNIKDNPFRWVVSDSMAVSSKPTLFFSTRELAQAYLNKVWAENEYNNLLKTTNNAKTNNT